MSGMPSQTIIIESDEGSSDLNDETGKSLEESSGDDLEREAADGFAQIAKINTNSKRNITASVPNFESKQRGNEHVEKTPAMQIVENGLADLKKDGGKKSRQ